MENLVLIPGLACTAELYAPQLPVLGRIANVTVATHTGADTMADIARLILRAAPATFALAGLSMGGYLAFEIMRQAPDRVTKLALMDTSAKPDTPERKQLRRQQVAAVEARGMATLAPVMVPLLIHPDRLSDQALTDTIARMSTETGVTHFARQQAAIAERPDSRPDLAAIKCPTMVLVGRQDQLTSPVEAEEIAGSIKGAKAVVVEHCGHLSTLERPEAVNAALLKWLGG